MMIYHALFLFLALCAPGTMTPMYRTNLFKPYDILLTPPPPPCPYTWQFSVGYEGAFRTRSFHVHSGDTVSVLQVWQEKQDGIAALKGLDSDTTIGHESQSLNINDDNLSHGIFIACGKLDIPLNLMLSARYHFPCNISLGIFLPIYYAQLHDVRWRQEHDNTAFEDIATPHFLKQLEALGDLQLTQGWKRTGVGDLVAWGNWAQVFPQKKPWLKEVPLGVRLGLLFPTGKSTDEPNLLRIPFGYDAGMGIIFGGTLGLTFKHQIEILLDLEFLHLFGNTHARRIRTDANQTDLLLLNRVRTFKDPGFTQKYTLGLQKKNIFDRFSGTIAYQYQRHNDDLLYPCSTISTPTIINDAESVQEWTTHQMVFMLGYQPKQLESSRGLSPHLLLFYKYGFNGKRSILTDSVGFQLSLDF